MARKTMPFTLANLPGGNNPVSDIDANFAAVCAGPAVSTIGNVPYYDTTDSTSLNAGYPTLPAFGTITSLVGVDGSNALPAVSGANLTNLPGNAGTTAYVRQTVTGGPVNGSGFASFLPATSVNLNLTTQNITGSVPFGVTSANSVQGSGVPQDRFGVTTSNITWSSLNANTLNYLYVTIAANGVLTTGFTTSTPIYTVGGTPSVSNGVITFDTGSMQCFLGNGATAPQTYLVVVGEAVTSGSAVTSTVMYTYNAKYDSGFTATLPLAATLTVFNHNLGVKDGISGKLVVECTTNDNGFTVGQQLHDVSLFGADGSGRIPLNLTYTNKTIALQVPSVSGLAAANYAAGGGVSLTVGNWKYKFVVTRDW